MTEPVLTIAVPTFNRPEQLRRCLEALVPQLTADCKLIIADNASPIPAEGIAKPILEQHNFSDVTIVRHAFNRGAHGNLFYCFESATTDWVWVMGDDDVPMPDAVNRLLQSIHQQRDLMAIVYNVNEFPDSTSDQTHVTEQTLHTAGEFLSSHAFYCGSLISSAAYNMTYIRKDYGVAYEYSSSYFPHVTWILNCLKKNEKASVLFHPSPLIRFCNDGEREKCISPILKNVRYLSRMLPDPNDRAALMNNSYSKSFVGPSENRLKLPGLKMLIYASAFRTTPSGKSVIFRARRQCGESFEFDNCEQIFPTVGLKLAFQLWFGLLVGRVFGFFIRKDYRLKKRKRRTCPHVFDSFALELIP